MVLYLFCSPADVGESFHIDITEKNRREVEIASNAMLRAREIPFKFQSEYFMKSPPKKMVFRKYKGNEFFSRFQNATKLLPEKQFFRGLML
jgi:hypothetical protein